MSEPQATRFVEFGDGLCVKYHPDVDYSTMGKKHDGFVQFRDMWESHSAFVRHKYGIGEPIDAAEKTK